VPHEVVTVGCEAASTSTRRLASTATTMTSIDGEDVTRHRAMLVMLLLLLHPVLGCVREAASEILSAR